MIFTTKNKEFAIFGNTIDDIRNKIDKFNEIKSQNGLFGENGAFTSLFSGKKSNIIPPEVLSQFDEFKEKFNSSSLSAEALAEQMENVDQRIVDYAKTCKNGEMTTEGFKASIDTMSLSSKAAKVGMEILKTACNMITFMLITKGIELAVKGLQNLNNSFEKAKERIDNLSQTYQENKNELEDINKTLEENKQHIQEILALEKPSYVDQKELKNLEREVELLERRKEILQHSQDATAKEAVEEIYNDFINRHDTNDEKREKAGKIDAMTFFTLGMSNYYKLAKVEDEATDREKVKRLTDSYDMLLELREKTLNSGSNTIEFPSNLNPQDALKLSRLGLTKDSSIGDIDKRLDSLRSILENYYADISEAILKINEFDPNLELEESQDLIRRQDNLYKYINYDEWVKSTVKRISTDENFSGITDSLKGQITSNLTDEDLRKQSETDESLKNLIKAIATNLYGKADEESKKKATSYLVDYLKEGIISEDGTVYIITPPSNKPLMTKNSLLQKQNY